MKHLGSVTSEFQSYRLVIEETWPQTDLADHSPSKNLVFYQSMYFANVKYET